VTRFQLDVTAEVEASDHPTVMSPSDPRYARVPLDGVPTFIALPAAGPAQILSQAPWAGGAPTGKVLTPTELQQLPLLCPVQPSKIIGIGRNYRKHAEELQNEVPEEPLMFFKPPSSLLDPGGIVLLPPESSRVDYEGELVVVIGRRAHRVGVDEARRAVFGYSIACDVTARDLQNKDKQWTRAKGFDTFCPIGPYVAAHPDPAALGVRLTVNGEIRQDGKVRDMIFDVPALVAYVSQSMTLEPGDVILTGTPEGVGPLVDGDAVSVRIDPLGELVFRVATERR
jgi:2-keto-4-pentenoate hydratase/2-oxohepta-3-ene-1,7-dioic acid hydratase in catechol pathway